MKKPCNLTSYIYADSCQSTSKKAARQTNTEFVKLRCRWTESFKIHRHFIANRKLNLTAYFRKGLTDKCGNHFRFLCLFRMACPLTVLVENIIFRSRQVPGSNVIFEDLAVNQTHESCCLCFLYKAFIMGIVRRTGIST